MAELIQIEQILTIGQAIKLFRTQQELSQCRLAKMCNTSSSTIGRIEHNNLNVKFDTIVEVFYRLGYVIEFKLKENT
jgi:transcriptional regulator with XRE-family HTH domain